MKLFAVVGFMVDGRKIINSIWTTKEAASEWCDLEFGDSVLEFSVNEINNVVVS